MPFATVGHPRAKALREDDRRPQVDVQRVIDLVDRDVDGVGGAADAGVGDQDVGVGAVGDEPRHVVAAGEVGDDRAAVDLGRQRVEHVFAARGEDQLRALGVQCVGDRLSDAAGGAGQQDGCVTEFHGGDGTGTGAWALDARSGARARRSAILAGVSPIPPDPGVIAVIGPTAVGKTAFAIALAGALRARGEDPVAVSADALQVYRGVELLTGAASAAEQAALEHRLSGCGRLSDRITAGRFAQLAHAEIDGLLSDGRRPIVVGGTGLYLRAALADLALRPVVAPAVRAAVADEVDRRGAEAAHARLAARAPGVAAAIATTDRQRDHARAGTDRQRPVAAVRRRWRAVDDRHPPPDAPDRPRARPRRTARADRRARRPDRRGGRRRRGPPRRGGRGVGDRCAGRSASPSC